MSEYQHDKSMGKLSLWLPALLATVLALGVVLGIQLNENQPTVIRINAGAEGRGVGRVEEVLRYVESKYVDGVDRNTLVESAIIKLLEELDPHSSYISRSDLAEVNEQLEGNFEGVGIEFVLLDDTLMVITPISGGPSERVGILAGDRIIQINDTLVAGVTLSNRDVFQRLRGNKGSKVKLSVQRAGVAGLLDFVVERDEIPIRSVDAAYMLDGNVGYLKISRFSATTYQEFAEALERLSNEGMQHLVIDVRQNPGGYLNEATRMLNQIVSKRNELLVYTDGEHAERHNYHTSGPVLYDIRNVAVLIDEGSASASEILAGAIQDLDRGLIIGRRSFGKGLVQEQYPLSDGSALRLTVARYFTPSGRSIQKPYDDLDDYGEDMAHRFETGELKHADSIHIMDSTDYFTVYQKRKVFGGGGIIPDVFVPIEPVLENRTFISLMQYLPDFSYRYVNENRQALAKWDETRFVTRFAPDDALLDRFIAYAGSKGIVAEKGELAAAKPYLRIRLKAFIARQLFGETAFHRVINAEDSVVVRALQLMRQKNPMSQYMDK